MPAKKTTKREKATEQKKTAKAKTEKAVKEAKPTAVVDRSILR